MVSDSVAQGWRGGVGGGRGGRVFQLLTVQIRTQHVGAAGGAAAGGGRGCCQRRVVSVELRGARAETPRARAPLGSSAGGRASGTLHSVIVLAPPLTPPTPPARSLAQVFTSLWRRCDGLLLLSRSHVNSCNDFIVALRLLCLGRLSETPWTTAGQASPSFTISEFA